jgi:hypothetical protein
MAFRLSEPRQLEKAGWKIKIRDKERLEEPHLTIIKGTDSWRYSLRSRNFLDEGRWKDFPKVLRETIEKNWVQLCNAWDAMYPHNPISTQEDENDDKE